MLKVFGAGMLAIVCVQLSAAEPTEKVKDMLKPPMLDILTNAERIETFRIKEKDDGKVEVLAKGAIWKDEKAKAVTAILLDEKSYEWERKKLCDPQPGVMFKFYKGESSVEARLCFECDMVVFKALDAKGKEVAIAVNDDDPARPKLVKLAKEALPDDKIIQALKEQR